MNVFHWLGRAVGSGVRRLASSVSDLMNPKKWLMDWSGGGRQTLAGEYVTPETAMGLSVYYACGRNIAEDVGKLPLKVYRRLDPRGKKTDRDHPVYRLLHDSPNDEMSAMSFRELLTHWAVFWGDGFARIDFTGTRPERLVPFHPAVTTIQRKPNGRLEYVFRYRDPQGVQQEEHHSPDRILHIHGLGNDGLRGYSIARIGAESLGLTLAAQSFGASFFGNGSALGGVMEMPGAPLSAEAEERFRKDWNEKFQGPQNVGKMAILYAAAKYNRIGIPPDEAQFLETRQFQIPDICRWFRMPPHKVQHLINATFSNIEHQAIEYVVDTLHPWLVRWEQEIQRKLFFEEPDFFAEHLVDGLLRGDSVQRANAQHLRFLDGNLSQNDVREIENQNPIGPDGDVYYVPMNMVRSQDAAAGIGGSPGPEPAAGQPPNPPPPMQPGEDMPAMDPESPEDPNPPPGAQAAEVELRETGLDTVRRIFSPLFLDAARRVVRKESNAVGRAAEKHGKNCEAFRAWAADFFGPDHLAFMVETFNALAGAAVDLGALPPLLGRESVVLVGQLDCARATAARLFDAGEILAGFVEPAEERARVLAAAMLEEVLSGEPARFPEEIPS